MSSSNILKSIAVILLGGVVGYSSVQFFKKPTKNRFIASQNISKLGQDQTSRTLFDVQLDLNELAKDESDVSTIKVIVQALKDFPDGLNYRWNLPADVEIVEGSPFSILGNFTAGQSKEFILKVKNFSKSLRKYISFEVQGELNQYAIKREVLISSRVEDSFEYLLQQNELKNNKPNTKLGLDKTKSRFSPEKVIR